MPQPSDTAALLPLQPSPGLDRLGCASDKLVRSEEFFGGNIRFHRKRARDGYVGWVSTPATAPGFLVGVSQVSGHRRRIVRERHTETVDFDANAVYVRNFADDFRAELSGSFDFLVLEIPHERVERASREAGGVGIEGLQTVFGQPDPTLAHLLSVLTPALSRPSEASPLFIDQLATATGTYLLEKYGRARTARPSARRALSRTHEARAKDMLLAHLGGNISIGEVADACGLSRSYFTTAFRATTGLTPHQWLLAQRVDMAKEQMLRSNQPLATIAALCGFADQSHFTRVFTQSTGRTPGAWRRDAQA